MVYALLSVDSHVVLLMTFYNNKRNYCYGFGRKTIFSMIIEFQWFLLTENSEQTWQLNH
jgi:hypothetical protein